MEAKKAVWKQSSILAVWKAADIIEQSACDAFH